MIYTSSTGRVHMIDLDPEMIIGLRLNNFTWEECIKRHNTFYNKRVPVSHITNPSFLRSSQEWKAAIETYWDKYYNYILQPHTKAAQRLNYHVEINYPIIETFGVEIEFFSEYERSEIRWQLQNNQGLPAELGDYRDWNRENWIVKTDGSLDPPHDEYCAEIASPILRHDTIDEDIKKVCQTLRNVGAGVNRTCGLHIHLGEHNLSGKRRSKIAYQFIKNERSIDKIMPSSRRGSRNGYCEGWDADREYYRDELKNKTSRSHIKNIVNPYGRYKKLNIQTPYTTIENRQHSGTTNYKKIIHWKDFLVGMCQYAIDEPFPDEITPEPIEDLIGKIALKLPEDKQTSFKQFYAEREEKFESSRGEQNEYDRDNEEIPY